MVSSRVLGRGSIWIPDGRTNGGVCTPALGINSSLGGGSKPARSFPSPPPPSSSIAPGEQVGYTEQAPFVLPVGDRGNIILGPGGLGSGPHIEKGTPVPEVVVGPDLEGPPGDFEYLPGTEGYWEARRGLPTWESGSAVIDPTYESPAAQQVEGDFESTPDFREDVEMAVDWGDVFGTAATSVIQGLTGISPPTQIQPMGYASPGTTAPAKVTVDTRTGAVTACRRRRRRRLLTPTDLSDLAALQALVGKGSSALNMAVAKAVRR